MTMGKKSPTSIPDAHQETIEQVRQVSMSIVLTQFLDVKTSFCLTTSGGSSEGARGPLLFFDQNEARRAEKNLFLDRPLPLSQGLDDRPNPTPLPLI